MDKKEDYPHLVWDLIDSREDRSYRLFSVRINRNRSPRTGVIHEFQVLTSPDWVTVIPLTEDNKVVMVRQYRHGSGHLALEPPGGLVKDGQTAEQSAVEELEEETGYVPGELELLGRLSPMPALFDNTFYVYIARNVKPHGTKHPDETEDVETVLLSVDEVRDKIRSGEIDGSVMIAALHLFLDWADRHPKLMSSAPK
jgi:8-oxo-dGTP pyrophosphatase MutT (NUDIX family)